MVLFQHLTMAKEESNPQKPSAFFLQIKQEEAQKSVQVTTLPLLLGSMIMSIPCCLATSISHPIHTAKCP